MDDKENDLIKKLMGLKNNDGSSFFNKKFLEDKLKPLTSKKSKIFTRSELLDDLKKSNEVINNLHKDILKASKIKQSKHTNKLNISSK